MTKDVALSTYDMFVLANGLRAAVNLGIGGFAMVAKTDNSTLNGANNLAYSKRTILVTWAATEYVFAAFVLLHLAVRWGWKFCTNDAEITPPALNVLLIRFFMAVLSLISGTLLKQDPEGENDDSTVAVGLIVLSTFLSNTIIEKFRKNEAFEDEARARFAMFGNQTPYPEGFTTNMDHQYGSDDVRLVWRSIVRQYDRSLDNTILNGNRYRAERNGGIPGQIVLVAPPVLALPYSANGIFEDSLGKGNVGVFFDAPTHANHFGAHILQQIQNELIENQAHEYQILFPCKGLDPNVADRWWGVEINISQRIVGANKFYDITILGHSAYGGTNKLSTQAYYDIARRMYQRLTGIGIPAAEIRFRSKTDITNRDLTNPTAINIGTAMLGDEAGALVAGNIPESPHQNARLDATSTLSYLATLDDLSKRLKGERPHAQQLSVSDIKDIRDKFRANVLFYSPANEIIEFKNSARREAYTAIRALVM